MAEIDFGVPVLRRAPMRPAASHQRTPEPNRAASAADPRVGAFEHTPFGIAIVDAGGIVRFANPAFGGMLGTSPDELRGLPIENALAADERLRLAALIEAAAHAATETRLMRRDGTMFAAQLDVVAVPGADGGPLYRVVSVFDVTLRKRAEQDLTHSRRRSDELLALIDTLQAEAPIGIGFVAGVVAVDVSERRRMEQQLHQAQKMEAIGNLTGGMAHDFNNLLGVIICNLELARPLVEGNAEARDLVAESLEAALRGAGLTRRLLAFARRQPLQPYCVQVNDLVAAMMKLLGRTLGEDMRIELDLADGLWPIIADPSQVEASLANLATNARDAMPAGGWLRIATANRHLDADDARRHGEIEPGDYVMIEVSDTGTGMTPEVMSQIFEPFFTTKGPGKGTGLGLSMVFGFMKQSGGHVSVESEPGRGSTFRLYLPRLKDAAAAVEAPAAGEAPRGNG